MGRVAALGCSHTCGYHVKDIPEDKVLDINTWPFSGKWHDNNWAEFYTNNAGKDGVIFEDCVFDNGRVHIDTDDQVSFLGFEDVKKEKKANRVLDAIKKRQEKLNNN